MVASFINNCPILEFTADGIPVGRCWYYLKNNICPRHGNVALERDRYIKTGKLSPDPNRKPTPSAP